MEKNDHITRWPTSPFLLINLNANTQLTHPLIAPPKKTLTTCYWCNMKVMFYVHLPCNPCSNIIYYLFVTWDKILQPLPCLFTCHNKNPQHDSILELWAQWFKLINIEKHIWPWHNELDYSLIFELNIQLPYMLVKGIVVFSPFA